MGTFVFVRPNVERTALAVEPETTIIAIGSTPGTAYEPNGFEVWAPLGALTGRASTPRPLIAGRS